MNVLSTVQNAVIACADRWGREFVDENRSARLLQYNRVYALSMPEGITNWRKKKPSTQTLESEN